MTSSPQVSLLRAVLAIPEGPDATAMKPAPFQALLVAAVAEELHPLPGTALGVGPVRAALGASAALTAPCDAVILIGTAGAYPGGPPIGTVVAARRVGLGDGTAAAGLGYVPLPPAAHLTDARLRTLSGQVEADVLTVPAITTDPTLTATFATDWQVEHLEAWSVAEAAARHGVPFIALLGISNVVGPDAHAQWKANRHAAEAAARDAASTLIAALVTDDPSTLGPG